MQTFFLITMFLSLIVMQGTYRNIEAEKGLNGNGKLKMELGEAFVSGDDSGILFLRRFAGHGG